MRKLAVILTSAVLAFSAVGCQAWGSGSSCNKCNCKHGKCNKCNKCNKRNNNCNCCRRGR